jgi:hypothetical protein
MEHTNKFQQRQTSLKVVPRKPLRAGGLQPATDMQPGEYLCACEAATDTIHGKSRQAILQFRIVDGPHAGTALRQWLTISDVGGLVSLYTRYAKHCAIALGRELEPGDSLEPEPIFPGKIFVVEVGYRKTEKMGGPATPENAQHRKDAKDFLRVHEILELRDHI